MVDYAFAVFSIYLHLHEMNLYMNLACGMTMQKYAFFHLLKIKKRKGYMQILNLSDTLSHQ